jgi:hypothetical protein
MKKYRVFVRGENFLINLDGVEQKLEIDSFEALPLPGTGFAFYPDEKEA